MPAVRSGRGERGIARFPGPKSPANTFNRSGRATARVLRRTCGARGLGVRCRFVPSRARRASATVSCAGSAQRSLRWTFIVIGALATASVLFAHLYRVNESIYDPSLFAIGIGGLFCLLCGVMLMVLSRNSRLRHGAASRQNPLRGTGRQHLGIEGGRGAGHEPARGAGRSDRPPRQRRPHHLRQRRLLRADRHGARGAARHARCAAVAAAGPRRACCRTARGCTTSRS